MSLEDQVTAARKDIKSDAYPMSIGELVNIYNDGELDIHPEFQREFRWKPHQKSKLIESLLLSIPIPSIFVSQRKDGVWDLVDGVQRISTIFQFMGVLKDEGGNLLEPLVLEKTHYLKDLENVCWNSEDGKNQLPLALKRTLKREKLDLKILLRESDQDAKYELFQRLNTGGTQLSDQEVRNCLLIMVNKQAYEFLLKANTFAHYQNSLCITQRQEEEKYSMELVLRFIIARRFDSGIKIDESDISPYLTAQMTALLVDASIDFDQELEHFQKVFTLIEEVLHEDSFKKFSQEKTKYAGAFSVPVYEVLTTGVGVALDNGVGDDDIKEKIERVSKELTSNTEFVSITAHGSRPVDRFPRTIELARTLFA